MSDRFLAGKRAARMKHCLCILLVRVDLMFDCGIIQVIVSGKKIKSFTSANAHFISFNTMLGLIF